ncbi:hypothetical protein ACFSRY_15240 [Pontibacter locisalis]|uniref:Uncharacterized protein n=1 Tax=Pontibacter locisalis TaxID=1719035 RepID=A0ABW5INM9_9BACT
MKDKHEIEHSFFNKLKELYSILPDGDISSPEPPDFMINTGREIIAVEVTQIHNEKGPNEKFPPAQKHATEDEILEAAQHLFTIAKGIPLHISFHFENNLILNKKRKTTLANQVCRLIELEMDGRTFDEHFSFSIKENLPHELVHVSGHYFHQISDVCWYSAKGRFVPDLSKRQVLNVIRDKEKKMTGYIDKVDKAILVLAEGLIPNSWFDGVEQFEQDELVSKFDKIFLIRYLSNTLIELK